jgi:hypothetical protein
MLLLDSEALSAIAHGPKQRRDRVRALVIAMRGRDLPVATVASVIAEVVRRRPADDERELDPVQEPRGRHGISRGDRIEEQPEDDHEEQVDRDEDLPLDVDPPAGGGHRGDEREEHQREEGDEDPRQGAMFSMTLCLASTSHVAMTAAPAIPHGRIQPWTSGSTSTPIAWKRAKVIAIRTPPPSAIST